jgi:hypothetical protein
MAVTITVSAAVAWENPWASQTSNHMVPYSYTCRPGRSPYYTLPYLHISHLYIQARAFSFCYTSLFTHFFIYRPGRQFTLLYTSLFTHFSFLYTGQAVHLIIHFLIYTFLIFIYRPGRSPYYTLPYLHNSHLYIQARPFTLLYTSLITHFSSLYRL